MDGYQIPNGMFGNTGKQTGMNMAVKIMTTMIHSLSLYSAFIRVLLFVWAVCSANNSTTHYDRLSILFAGSQKFDGALHLRVLFGIRIRLRERHDNVGRNAVSHNPAPGRRHPARDSDLERAVTEVN